MNREKPQVYWGISRYKEYIAKLESNIDFLEEKIKFIGGEDVVSHQAAQIALFNLIGEVLQEAQEHPQRLIAFNSPLLGMLLLRFCEHHNGEWSDDEAMAYNQFRAVIQARS